MLDILFVSPVFEKIFQRESMGTLLLATILKRNNIDVDIYRYYEADVKQNFDSFTDETVENIINKNPKIVSFYCRVDCILSNVIIAKKIKEKSPETIIIFGGPHADVVAKEILEHFSWVDYCCRGEGETTIYPLVRSLLDGEDVTFVKGLTYRSFDKGIISNETPELVRDLDALPHIDYKSLVPEALLKNATGAPLDVGRGCPFKCAYCSTSLFWQRKFRLKSPERIIAEIKELNTDYGICSFGFQHDLFTTNKKLVSEFCKALNNSKLNVEWSCSSRADTIDEQIIGEMAASGLKAIFLGIESGSSRMQHLIHKNLNIEKSVSVIQCLLDNNIKVTVSFMYGFPEETYEDIEQTLQLIYRLRKMGVKSIQLHLCSIYPGTEYFKLYKEEMVRAETASNIVGDFGEAENEEFIRAHKDVFYHCWEYESELRTRLSGLSSIFNILIELFDIIKLLAPTRADKLPLLDLAMGLKDANADLLADNLTFDFCTKNKYQLFLNYLSTVYDASEIEYFKEYFMFLEDLEKFQTDDNSSTDVKSYNINIKDIGKQMSIKNIENKPCLVYFNKVNNKTSYIVTPLIK